MEPRRAPVGAGHTRRCVMPTAMGANAGRGIAVGWLAAERPLGQVPMPGLAAADRAWVPLDCAVGFANVSAIFFKSAKI